jgi:glycosyltransferase involved in cell wall biosynthesis
MGRDGNSGGLRLEGVLKKLEYRRLFLKRREHIDGVLATGHQTPAWVAARGMPMERVYPFAYFLPNQILPMQAAGVRRGPFRLAFVGQFIELKRLDLLISSLAAIDRRDVELTVVGSGPLEEILKSAANVALPGRVRWIGRLPIADVPQVIAQADCLVLPSRYDGWGAVVSEALMVGTPAICSDTCGSAGIVEASGVGGVFRSGDATALTALLQKVLDQGPLNESQRADLSVWAQALGTEAGAAYLRAILEHAVGFGGRPTPPWLREASGAEILSSLS